jgi:UDP-3-O-[3-hydroxymyristoyl] glucosamine N-acyltransferase
MKRRLESTIIAALLATGLPLAVPGQPVPLGPAFQVNHSGVDRHTAHDTAMDGAGNFVVTWYGSDDRAIRFQRFTAAGARLGDELAVTQEPPGNFAWPQVAMARNGEFVVVWSQSGEPVRGQRFDADGHPEGGEFELGIDSYSGAAVGMSPHGAFVVAWSGYYGPLDLQVFDAVGARVGAPIMVSNDGVGPAAAMRADGELVVLWRTLRYPQDVVGRRYDASGNAIGEEFAVSQYTLNEQYAPAVSMADDGSFVAVWGSSAWPQQSGQDGSGTGIFARRFDRDARPLGPEFQVATRTLGAQRDGEVAVDRDGGFTVVWAEHDDPTSGSGPGRVFGRRFDSAGRRAGGEFEVATFESYSGAPRVAAGKNDVLAMTWQNTGSDDRSRIFARRFVDRGAAGATDGDGDDVADVIDNCPTVANADQADAQNDGHGDACVSPDVLIPASVRLGRNPIIGRGTTILANVVVGDDATLGEYARLERQARIGDRFRAGDYATIGRGSTVGHDVSLGLASRLAANVTVGDGAAIADQVVARTGVVIGTGARIGALVVLAAGARIGDGATVEMGATIGRNATIGAGTVVPAGTSVAPGTTFP